MPEVPDLFDHEVFAFDQAIVELNEQFMRLDNTEENTREFEKVAKQKMYDIGLVVDVDAFQHFMDFNVPVKIDVIDRVNNKESMNFGTDHERKRYEILRSMETGKDKRARQILGLLNSKQSTNR